MNNTFSHIPVMLWECIEGLNIKQDGVYVDCTAGGGGHSEEIIKRLNDSGRLIAVDRDKEAIDAVKHRLARWSDRLTLVQDNFANSENFLLGVKIDGVLADLGVSSHQLDTAERGFSYNNDAPLDMRMDRSSEFTAYNVVNDYNERELSDIIFKWGEERFARRIAANIVSARDKSPIKTTAELADIIKYSIPAKARENGPHPAKRTFQAIRIEVNGELDLLEQSIVSLVTALKSGGRIVVITFHSLEDRIVKQTFSMLAKGCVCPNELPICVCGKTPKLKIITRKPLLPSESEERDNPRSRSAKMRIAEKI